MSSSEARIQANIRNAARSTGPRTDQGKSISCRNSLKHGLTGAGIVIPEADAAEVERRAGTFAEELKATGDVGLALARRAALNSVRMERGADQQAASLTERVRQVEADFVAPEGVDAAEADRLKVEAARRAMFDPTKEAALARQYEAAAERAFFRCLKELKQREKAAKAEQPGMDLESFEKVMGSYFAPQPGVMTDAEFDAMCAADLGEAALGRSALPAHLARIIDGVDVPITIGRRR